DIQPGFAFSQEIAAPGGENVGPSFDGVDVTARRRRREVRRPPVILAQCHGRARPFVGSFAPPQQLGSEDGMPVANNVGPDIHLFADDSLDRETACIDGWVHVLDVNALPRKGSDGSDAHVGCHGSIVAGRPARTPGRRKELTVMEPIRPRFGSMKVPSFDLRLTTLKMMRRLEGTNPDRPGFAVVPR